MRRQSGVALISGISSQTCLATRMLMSFNIASVSVSIASISISLPETFDDELENRLAVKFVVRRIGTGLVISLQLAPSQSLGFKASPSMLPRDFVLAEKFKAFPGMAIEELDVRSSTLIAVGASCDKIEERWAGMPNVCLAAAKLLGLAVRSLSCVPVEERFELNIERFGTEVPETLFADAEEFLVESEEVFALA
jgi:hypothetical protein